MVNNPSTDKQSGFDELFNKAPVVMFVLDSERRIRHLNDAAVAMTSRPRNEIIGLKGGDAMCCLNRLDKPNGC
jgi:PAS domain-containing protein